MALMHFPTKSEHRSDIEVLRCLAVVAVVLFHFNIPFFSGGYVGVDVFFVISGYLVARMVTPSVPAGGLASASSTPVVFGA